MSPILSLTLPVVVIYSRHFKASWGFGWVNRNRSLIYFVRRFVMGKINAGRVILGGLFAGLAINIGEFVLNGVVLAKDWDDAMKKLSVPAIGGKAIAYFVVLAFLIGIVAVWLYAAIRPRFGAGVKTAICAGIIVWILSSLFTAIGQLPTEIFPTKLVLLPTLWGLFEIPIGTVAGAWLYKEE